MKSDTESFKMENILWSYKLVQISSYCKMDFMLKESEFTPCV